MKKKEKKLKVNLVPTNFVYPEIKPEDYKFGRVAAPVLLESGDWRNYTPPEEIQNKNGVESSACFIEAIQHSLATIQEEQFGLPDQNYSSRFNLNFADAGPFGGSPLKGAQAIRDYGLVPDECLPFSDDIKSWEEFNSFKGGNKNECIAMGKEWRKHWNPLYEVAFTRFENVESKYAILREALKSCPPPVSVYAWVQDENGVYVKPAGAQDQHLVELVYIDEDGCPYIWDTYPPFLKKLAPYFNFDFGMRVSLEKTEPEIIKHPNWVVELFKNLFAFIKDILFLNKTPFPINASIFKIVSLGVARFAKSKKVLHEVVRSVPVNVVNRRHVFTRNILSTISTSLLVSLKNFLSFSAKP